MKKIMISVFSLIGMICLICVCTAEGGVPSIRETIQAEQGNDAFSFRNGIGWNMDMDQVRVRENIPMTERISSEWSVMMTNDPVPVSRFTADLVFIFYQNQLKMITYEFQSDGSTLNYQYLLGALCSVYGDNRSAEATVIKSMMDRIYPNRYRTDWIHDAYTWTTTDGTNIFLYYFSTNAYAILYTSPELTVGSSGGYETNGL